MKKMKTFQKISTHFFIALILCLPLFAYAQNIGIQNPIKVNSISGLILIVTRVVRYVAIPFIVIMIMYSGFLYILPTGWNKPSDHNKANTTLWYTIIGAFILLSSELIALVMKNTIEGLTK